jgi:hypothetical protein
LGLQRSLCRQLAQGEAHYQEPVVWEALWEMADAGAQARAAQTLISARISLDSPWITHRQAAIGWLAGWCSSL